MATLSLEERKEIYIQNRISCAHIALKKIEDLRWWIQSCDLELLLRKDCEDSLNTIRDTIRFALGYPLNKTPF